MKRPLFSLLIVFCFLPSAYGLEASADPSLAVVRIKSHGASATIIATTEGRSWILGCAHMLTDDWGRPDPKAIAGPFKIDGPVQPYAPKKLAPVRLLAYDINLDLSLLEIDNGPFNYLPVAKPGHKPSRHIQSLGYDEMKWPITNKSATILFSQGDTTYTAEKPWHGRSGGGLIDVDSKCLIGVVQGYEVSPTARGLYISHDAILRFLVKHWPVQPRSPPQPNPVPHNFYSDKLANPLCPGNQSPRFR